jgi:hypothetical protein
MLSRFAGVEWSEAHGVSDIVGDYVKCALS